MMITINFKDGSRRIVEIKESVIIRPNSDVIYVGDEFHEKFSQINNIEVSER